MSEEFVIEYVIGELTREGEDVVAYRPKLKLTIKEYTPNEPREPARFLQEEELTPTRGMFIEDGKYTLRYLLDGKQQERKVRMRGGRL